MFSTLFLGDIHVYYAKRTISDDLMSHCEIFNTLSSE